MLTGNLLRFSRRQGQVVPRLIDPADPAQLELAQTLLAQMEAHVGRPRGELEAELQRLAPAGRQALVARGLARLLLDSAQFEAAMPVEPRQLRAEVFEAAAQAWRTQASLADLPRWRAELLARVGAAHGLDAEHVPELLYADLPENQLLVRWEPLTPTRLLQRYNVAQVQGLLLGAERVRVTAPWPSPQRLRQLLRWLKFHGLLFRLLPQAPAGLALEVDGPLSMLDGAGTPYGLNLALWLPALLLWPGPWSLTAWVRVGRASQALPMALQPHPALVSHLPDTGQWVPPAVRDLVSAFNAQPGAWRALPAENLLLLPGNAYLIPDLELVHASSGRRVAVEHVLYPTPERMAAQLGRIEALLERGALPLAGEVDARPAPYADYWLACKQQAQLPESPRLMTYRRALLASHLRTRLERLASPAQPSLVPEH